MKKDKMIYVRWIDSALTSEWTEAPTNKTGVIEIDTIGYLIHEDENHIEVAQNKTSAHKCAIMAIPQSVILKRRILKVKK